MLPRDQVEALWPRLFGEPFASGVANVKRMLSNYGVSAAFDLEEGQNKGAFDINFVSRVRMTDVDFKRIGVLAGLGLLALGESPSSGGPSLVLPLGPSALPLDTSDQAEDPECALCGYEESKHHGVVGAGPDYPHDGLSDHTFTIRLDP